MVLIYLIGGTHCFSFIKKLPDGTRLSHWWYSFFLIYKETPGWYSFISLMVLIYKETSGLYSFISLVVLIGGTHCFSFIKKLPHGTRLSHWWYSLLLIYKETPGWYSFILLMAVKFIFFGQSVSQLFFRFMKFKLLFGSANTISDS